MKKIGIVFVPSPISSDLKALNLPLSTVLDFNKTKSLLSENAINLLDAINNFSIKDLKALVDASNNSLDGDKIEVTKLLNNIESVPSTFSNDLSLCRVWSTITQTITSDELVDFRTRNGRSTLDDGSDRYLSVVNNFLTFYSGILEGLSGCCSQHGKYDVLYEENTELSDVNLFFITVPYNSVSEHLGTIGNACMKKYIKSVCEVVLKNAGRYYGEEEIASSPMFLQYLNNLCLNEESI